MPTAFGKLTKVTGARTWNDTANMAAPLDLLDQDVTCSTRSLDELHIAEDQELVCANEFLRAEWRIETADQIINNAWDALVINQEEGEFRKPTTNVRLSSSYYRSSPIRARSSWGSARPPGPV